MFLSSPLCSPLALLGWLALAPPLSAGDEDRVWPDYRGPGQDGQAAGAQLPMEWSEAHNLLWKTPIHGRGHSSPVVWGDLAWLTTATPEGQRMSVLCVDVETGDVLHDILLFEIEEPEFRNKLNSYASPSPVVAEGRVWVHFGTYGTACIDADSGEVLWQRRDLNCQHLMGPGSSPVLFDSLLLLQLDGADVQYLVALDRETGETVWRTDRSTDFTNVDPDMQKAYGTPLLTTRDGAPHLVSTGAQASFGYDPRTGKELWTVRHTGFSMSARPLESPELYIVNTGFMNAALVAIRKGGEGDVSDTHVAWRYAKNVATMASAVIVGELLFMVDDGGIATCLKLADGQRLWRERIGGEHCASPIACQDRVYFFDRSGQTVVVRAAPEFEVLATNQLGDGFMASPAVVGNDLVLRSSDHLYRVGRRDSPGSADR